MIMDVDKFNNYSIDSLKAMVNNEYELIQEVEETNGLILYVLLLADIKPDYSFFIKFVNEHTISFFGQFYPDLAWKEILDTSAYKTYLSLDLEDLYSNDKTILSKKFKEYDFSRIDEKDYKKEFNDLFLNSFPGQVDLSRKIADFTKVLEDFVPILKVGKLFDFDFFDNFFLNLSQSIKNNSKAFKYNYSLSLKLSYSGEFIFALKLYLIHVATNDLHRDNFIYRRIYAETVIAMARFQMFASEPKFFHRIFPILIQTSSLAVVLDNLDLFIDVKNHVFIESLIKKSPSINLIITLIFALKMNSSRSEGATKDWGMKMLVKSLKGVSDEDFSTLIRFTSFTLGKDSSLVEKDNAVNLSEDAYCNFFNNAHLFFETISFNVLSRFSIHEVLNLVGGVSKEWNMSFILVIEKQLGEKAFNKYVINQVNAANSLFDLNKNMLKVAFSRVYIAEKVLNKFPREVEQMLSEDILKEGFSFLMMRGEKEEIKANIATVSKIEHPEMMFLKEAGFAVGVSLLEKFTSSYLDKKDYKSFYFLVRLLKRVYHMESRVVKVWQLHLNQLSVTDILLNSQNVYFVLIMNTLSKFGINFHNVKNADAMNVYAQLNPFFAEKDIPLSWLKNLKLSLEDQERFLPGIILRNYDKRINHSITHKMSPENFKNSLVSYLDSFLIEEVPNKFQISNVKNEFDPLFVNKHLKAYQKSLPQLLTLLEDRPEYYVIVAICAVPEMAGTLTNKLKHISRMRLSEVLKMNVKDILTLNFDKYWNLTEEQFLFLNGFINWEIAFKGIFKLVKNVYWIAQNRANDVNAQHVKTMIEYTFYSFKSIYSYSSKVNESDVNLNYSYFLEPAFFFLLQNPQERKESINIGNSSSNFTISLLRHIKYEMGNDDKELFSSLLRLIDAIASGKHYWKNSLSTIEPVDEVVYVVEKLNGINSKNKTRNIMAETIFIEALKDISNSKDLRVVILFEYIRRYLKKATHNNDILTKKNNRYFATFITLSNMIQSSGLFDRKEINDEKARAMLMNHLIEKELLKNPLNANQEDLEISNVNHVETNFKL